MNKIVFIDSEIDPNNNKVLDVGCITDRGEKIHSGKVSDLLKYIDGATYICGHNIINHDIPHLEQFTKLDFSDTNFIDTLHLSPLLFPKKPYHRLLKDDKLQTDELNNPLNDAIKAKDLFYDEVSAFQKANTDLKNIFHLLLKDRREFASFFTFAGYKISGVDAASLIRKKFFGRICDNALLENLIKENPIELAYCLALIDTDSKYSITPPWVTKNYPDVARVMYLLNNNPCVAGCSYCNQFLDTQIGLETYFGFDSYRTYEGSPLQEESVKAAIDNKSLLAVFPTGGGKSIAFQVPALMSGRNVRGLTVVISPLQSLMKDQVDNLEKANIMESVTINGLLDPIERAKAFERVEDGSASILYISPESLRSKTIEHLLLGRNVVRFVIDEAHCLSSWGQDFRVDYLYIGDFIKSFQEKKNLEDNIPVSCFTATAKPQVIQDIKDYFHDKLSLQLKTFKSSVSRSNLQYKVIPKESEDEKYKVIRDLIDKKQCPTIVYVSRTYRARKLAERLSDDGYLAKPYYGKMDKQEKNCNQDAFIRGDVQIIVATSAFGMGVDKKDVEMVIHYEISDSLENYIQEAGRAGRDEDITADCYVLFNEEDLSKHFILLNQTKINIREIQQIWKAVKDITRLRARVSNSALEIARKAGWDDSVVDIESRVTTAIAALEEAGYLRRGQNMPRIFASGILSKNAQEAIEKIDKFKDFNDKQKQQAVRIVKRLFSAKSHKHANDEEAETRVDYISDHLAITPREVIDVVNKLREEHILADTKDLTAFIKQGEKKNRSLKIFQAISEVENFFLSQLEEQEQTFHMKELNDLADKCGCKDVSLPKLKAVIDFWVIKNWLKRKQHGRSRNHITVISNYSKSDLKDKLIKRHELARFIVEFLFSKRDEGTSAVDMIKEQVLVDFSVHELKSEYEQSQSLTKFNVTVQDIEDTLFYLSRINAITIEGGFLVVYNRLTVERLEQDNKKRYTAEDYKKLDKFYENRIQQIHIVGEYAKKMIGDYKAALQFVEDYFQLNYSSFLNKYFQGGRQQEIKKNITPTKFRQLFGELSPAQLNVIKDNKSQYIAVAAGPGSGKTRVLVHKLASLLLMEDVKHEQLLMITFSRAAATEFQKRLFDLIGNAARFVEIKTFHSYCFDLLGKVGSIEESETVINKAVERINNEDIEPNRITKSVLVIDEAQDMSASEFGLIQALMKHNEEMRVIAVGDDDQNIYEFRGSSSQYLEQFINEQKAKKYELNENYRSKNNLVQFTNQFVETIGHRLKEIPIVAHQRENGSISLIQYESGARLVSPVVKDVMSTDLSGTTCVLTRTNDEALQVAGLLVNEGIPAKLIQTNEGFNLYGLLEIRYFIQQLNLKKDAYIISEDDWKKAKRELWTKYKSSDKVDICINLIKEFEASNPNQKYQSDFEIFVKESKLEDFIDANGEIVFVSTMHKSKGKEFDNVFLMLDGFNPVTDEQKRQLYVAMTRAKQNLSIHLNGRYLDDISCKGINRKVDNAIYNPADLLVLHLSHKDIWLDYFISRQHLLSSLRCGDILSVDNEGCLDDKGDYIAKFSKGFKEKSLAVHQGKGYKLVNAGVNYMVYWQKEDTDIEVKIVLPELKLGKMVET